MNIYTRSLRLALVAVMFATLCGGPAWADAWLVYLGGGLEPIDGGWENRQGRVVVRTVGGTLISIPFSEVDLPASAFITWQLNGRMKVPSRGPVEESVASEGESERPCVAGRVVRLVNGETLEILIAGERETVHVACLDAPDTRHRFSELGWYGRASMSAIEQALRKNAEVCVTELSKPQRDQEGHRIVQVTLASGYDYAGQVIGSGLGLLRLGPCERASEYRRLEDQAVAGERGLWGAMGEKAAFAAVGNSVALGGGGGGAPPPRRVGGG